LLPSSLGLDFLTWHLAPLRELGQQAEMELLALDPFNFSVLLVQKTHNLFVLSSFPSSNFGPV
jgi:hypothetical protein